MIRLLLLSIFVMIDCHASEDQAEVIRALRAANKIFNDAWRYSGSVPLADLATDAGAKTALRYIFTSSWGVISSPF